MNDPLSLQVEARLRAANMHPLPGERERLLYECGRAVGRAEARPQVRRISVAAAVLMCAIAGLGYRVLTFAPADATSPQSPAHASPQTARATPAERPALEPGEPVWNGQLTLGISLDQLERTLAMATTPPEGTASDVPTADSEPPLTAGSQFEALLWN